MLSSSVYEDGDQAADVRDAVVRSGVMPIE